MIILFCCMLCHKNKTAVYKRRTTETASETGNEIKAIKNNKILPKVVATLPSSRCLLVDDENETVSLF